MCFSATASFAASAALLTVGAVTIKKVKIRNEYPLAAIPLVFAFQQFCEGIVWVTMDDPSREAIYSLAKYSYLFIAYGVWLVAPGLVVLSMESNGYRRRILGTISASGFLLSLWMMYRILTRGADVQFMGNLFYAVDISSSMAVTYLYLAISCVPFLISSTTKLRVLGAILVFGFIVSLIFYNTCLTSVWCFFAAVASIYIYFTVSKFESPEVRV